MRRGNLFVISGPSGAGKGTLVARLLHEISDAWLSISVTTRSPRDYETEGVQYHFITEAAFDELVAHAGLLEWAVYEGHRYGSPREPVMRGMEANEQVVLEIDVQGAFQIKQQIPSAHLIFIEPPSLEELERRLRARGTETDEVIASRIETAKVELSYKMDYDIRIINDKLDEAARELIAYVNECANQA